MREVARSALIPFSAEQAFSVVADVESYSTFLPWCAESQVISIEGNRLVGKLTLAKIRDSPVICHREPFGTVLMDVHESGRWSVS